MAVDHPIAAPHLENAARAGALLEGRRVRLELTASDRRAAERAYARLLHKIHGGSWSVVRPEETARLADVAVPGEAALAPCFTADKGES